MAHTQTTITAPVSTTDVSAVLAVASHNIGYLCSNLHGKINKWSAHKPVISTNFNKSTEETFRMAGNGYGLDVFFTDDIEAVPSAYTTKFKTQGWDYELPLPSGKNTRYRLGDFDGYVHNAKPPFSLFECSASVKKGGRFEAQLYENSGTGRVNFYNLEYWDQGIPLVNFFFGVCFVNSKGKVVGAVTNTEPGNPYFMGFLPDNTDIIAGQTYRVYPFYSRHKLTADMEVWEFPNFMWDPAAYCPIPCVSEATMKIT
ncbi:MAG: hypothetical protein K2G69_09345 [Muribaculaceae bacterium]|nr:hypothetical protein [Muribaculaceae bacterium]